MVVLRIVTLLYLSVRRPRAAGSLRAPWHGWVRPGVGDEVAAASAGAGRVHGGLGGWLCLSLVWLAAQGDPIEDKPTSLAPAEDEESSDDEEEINGCAAPRAQGGVAPRRAAVQAWAVWAERVWLGQVRGADGAWLRGVQGPARAGSREARLHQANPAHAGGHQVDHPASSPQRGSPEQLHPAPARAWASGRCVVCIQEGGQTRWRGGSGGAWRGRGLRGTVREL